ncbi:MAG: hypothetical protein JNK04_16350, partial [Myxococcales bacterium]|nr:hypothetical protein [Myxococcales bacterium]
MAFAQWLGVTVIAGCLALPMTARASDRQFAYTYNTSTLAPGSVELEPWTTFRVGREDFYFRMDHRFELETGFTDSLQGALYFNVTATTADRPTDDGLASVRETEVEWKGVSLELKGKLSDAVADAVGFGLYLEPTIAPAEGELEVKALLDKRAGDFYFAYNLVGEWEVEFGEPGEPEHELVLENDIGLAGYVREDVTLGGELRNVNLFEVGEGFESSTFFIGPSVSIRQKRFFATASITPQIASIRGEEEEEGEGESEEEESVLDL